MNVIALPNLRYVPDLRRVSIIAGIESVDEKLDAAHQYRERCIDTLVQMLIEIDGCTQRIDVLLDRRLDQAQR